MNLRPYQVDSIEALRQGIKSGHNHQILCASTGAGKSIIAVEIIRLCKERGSRALFLVDRRVLVDQFSKHLDANDIDHGVLMSKHWRFRPQEHVQVVSIQTLERMESFPRFDIIIIDEAHAMLRKSIKTILKNYPNVKVTGLTATPFTKGIGSVYTNVVNVITMKQLVEQGFLVPYRVFVAHEIDMEGVKIKLGEFESAETEKRGMQIVGDIVSDYIAISTRTWGETRKTIVFCAGVAHGQELAKKFAEVGKNFISISYEDTDEFKDEVIKEFSKPDTDIDGLISTDILTRGFDVPDVEHVILARPLKKSLSLHIQMIGRGARIYPDKEFCIIQDHSGNYLRFKDDFDDVYSNGVHHLDDGREKPKKELTKTEKEKAKCPKCGALWTLGRSCFSCGFVIEKKSKIETVAGEMKELDLQNVKKEKFTSEFKEKFYQGLLFYARQKGMKDGWAFFQYKDKFNLEPSWKKIATPPNEDVLNFIKYKNIKNAKAKK